MGSKKNEASKPQKLLKLYVMLLAHSKISRQDLTLALDVSNQTMGEKGYIRIDGKPNIATSMKLVNADSSEAAVRDEAGASVRASCCTCFNSNISGHRMCDEFRAFADIIDRKDYERASFYIKETLDVMMVIDMIKDSL